MVKSILRKSKTGKKQTKRVHFNKYKKLKTIRKRLATTKKTKSKSKVRVETLNPKGKRKESKLERG
jgi:hypothetical protein